MAEARALAQQTGMSVTVAESLIYSSQLCWLRREPRLAEEWVRSVLPMFTKAGAATLPWMTITLGWALALQGDIQAGKALIVEGHNLLEPIRFLGNLPIWYAMLAEVCLLTGERTEALAALDEAVRITNDQGERRTESELQRLKGEALLQHEADPAQAEACFQRALDIARSQDAKGWELRSATSMARLWQKQGKRDEARALLQDVYGWFTEGFDTPDLKDAKALLDQL